MLGLLTFHRRGPSSVFGYLLLLGVLWWNHLPLFGLFLLPLLLLQVGDGEQAGYGDKRGREKRREGLRLWGILRC